MVELETIAIAHVMLRDGREVTVRPLEFSDRAAMLAFGRALPPDDRLYIPDDFESPDVINRLVSAHSADHWRQIVAVAGDMIVGYGAIQQQPGWSSHVAQLQLVVSSGWRRSGLGSFLAPLLLDGAREMGASKAIVEMIEEQVSGRAIFERIGFRVEARLANHARDRCGCSHSLVILASQIG